MLFENQKMIKESQRKQSYAHIKLGNFLRDCKIGSVRIKNRNEVWL